MEDHILVTGASGYIAIHVVHQLLQQNVKVRGTVRNLGNEKKVAPIQKLAAGKEGLLELVEADLLDEKSWPGAVKDCNYVIHVASPVPAKNPENEDEVIKPTGDTRIQKGDRVVIFAEREQVQKVEQLFRVSLEFF